MANLADENAMVPDREPARRRHAELRRRGPNARWPAG